MACFSASCPQLASKANQEHKRRHAQVQIFAANGKIDDEAGTDIESFPTRESREKLSQSGTNTLEALLTKHFPCAMGQESSGFRISNGTEQELRGAHPAHGPWIGA